MREQHRAHRAVHCVRQPVRWAIVADSGDLVRRGGEVNLSDMHDRLHYEMGDGREHEPLKLMDPDGARHDIISVNWDDRHGEWVIVTDVDQ